MSNVTPFSRRIPPETVGAFLDTRGGDRALRVTWHHEPAPHGAVVLLSMWRADVCVASFRLPIDEVPGLIAALRSGLDSAYETAYDAHAGQEPGLRSADN
ncbi:MAG: hypothetical protein ABI873_01840 [Marmoricola sp.]